MPQIQKKIDSMPRRKPTSIKRNASSVTPASSKTGVIRLSNGNFVGAGLTEAAYDRYQKLYDANDEYGKKQMYDRGLMIKLTDGTRLTIIDRGWSKTEVRVTSGLYENTACWIANEFVK